jgi:SNF2 family DNA or RNA helicase
VTLGESKQIFEDWNADKISVLLVHAASVAHGLNLQHGSAQDIIWHSLTFDLEIYDQLNARLARSGQKHKRIFSHLIVARDTTDEARLQALRRKAKTQRGFLEALRDYCKTASRR